MTPGEIAGLAAGLTALTGVIGLVLLPRTRRKLISDTGVSDATQAKLYSEMGMNALRAALEEAKATANRVSQELENVRISAEAERRLSAQRINQLLDDNRRWEEKVRKRDLAIIRLGGEPPQD